MPRSRRHGGPDLRELKFTRYRRRSVPRNLYFRILERDEYVCRYCRREYPDVIVGVDHVIPVVIGGSNDPSNLVACCDDCQREKGDKVDAVRDFWGPEHYAGMIRILIRDRNWMHEAAVELARESRERFGKGWRLGGIPEVRP